MPEPVCESKSGGGYKLHVVNWPLIGYFIRNTVL